MKGSKHDHAEPEVKGWKAIAKVREAMAHGAAPFLAGPRSLTTRVDDDELPFRRPGGARLVAMPVRPLVSIIDAR